MFYKKQIRFYFLALFLTLTLWGCGSQEVQVKKEVLGNPNGSIDFQIFSDLQCPACSKASNFLNILLEKYGDKMKITYYHFPLESIHPYAFNAAVAAECAGKQGAFWKYIKYAYKFQNELDVDNLKKHALNLGLDTELFNTCLDNRETAENVKADLKKAIKLDLKGTPSFVLNEKPLEFGLSSEDVLKKIDEIAK